MSVGTGSSAVRQGRWRVKERMRRVDGRVIGLVLERKALHVGTEDCMIGARWCQRERGHEKGACLSIVLYHRNTLSSIDAHDTVIVIPTSINRFLTLPPQPGKLLP